MTLDLQVNRIGAQGVKYLADALQNNTVKSVVHLVNLILFLLFNTDNHDS
jgi:hypothetical protein